MITISQAEATTAMETAMSGHHKKMEDDYRTNDQLLKDGEDGLPATTLHSCISQSDILPSMSDVSSLNKTDLITNQQKEVKA